MEGARVSETEGPLLRGTRAVAKRAPRARRSLPAAPRLEMPVLPGEEAPFLRPKQRTRVRRVRRGGLHQAALGLQGLAALLLLGCASWAAWRHVLHAERLRVRTVEVRGNRFLSEGEVRGLLGPADGANILTLDIVDLKRRLRASPWLEDASVRRTLPDTLQVDVREREPLALAEVGRLYLMDAEGDLIDLYGARTAGFDLPIVRGLGGLTEEQRRDRALRVATLLQELGDLQTEVSEVEVEPSGDLRLVLRRGGEILRLGAPPYRPGVAAFLDMRRELVEHCPDAEYFDLRFRGRIFAKQPLAETPQPLATPAPDAETPPATPSASATSQSSGALVASTAADGQRGAAPRASR